MVDELFSMVQLYALILPDKLLVIDDIKEPAEF